MSSSRATSLRQAIPVFHSIIVIVLFMCFAARPTACNQCLSPDQWFDIASLTCRPCSTCIPRKEIEMEACSSYADTLCIDMTTLDFSAVIGSDRHRSLENRDDSRSSGMRYQATPHVTHEVEFSDVDPPEGNRPSPERSSSVHPSEARLSAAENTPSLEPAPRAQHTPHPSDKKPYEAWSNRALVMLGIIVAVVLTIAVVLVVRQITRRRAQNAGGASRKTSGDFKLLGARSRLFSRDRLDTNEYIHTLATLDRKMAMDEILEKRREAILATEATSGDGVTAFGDEVFVDMMGQAEEEEEGHEQEARLMQKCETR